MLRIDASCLLDSCCPRVAPRADAGSKTGISSARRANMLDNANIAPNHPIARGILQFLVVVNGDGSSSSPDCLDDDDNPCHPTAEKARREISKAWKIVLSGGKGSGLGNKIYLSGEVASCLDQEHGPEPSYEPSDISLVQNRRHTTNIFSIPHAIVSLGIKPT